MTDYTIRKTDINEPVITVSEDSVVLDVLDIALIGRIRQNYGQMINENLLNLLENFACPESLLTVSPETAVPDLSKVSGQQLHNPTIGQFWYNTTRDFMYFFDGTDWVYIPPRGEYAANWGMILHGQQIPKPVSVNGKIYEYDECIWSVSPATINGAIDTLNCNTDASAVVTMRYRYANTETMVSGIANYLIIGIEGNTNLGITIPPIQVSVTPTPTASATPQPTPTMTPSVTNTVTPSVTASVTASVTPTPTMSATPTPTPAPSNSPVPSQTPVPSPVPVTYCYTVSVFCLGYGDSTLAYTPLRLNSTSTTPAPNVCSFTNTATSTGQTIRINDNMANTFPVTRIVVRVNGSDGSTSGDIEILGRMSRSVSNSYSEVLYRDINVNGSIHTLVINGNWYRHSGNSNNTNSTFTASYSFNTSIPRC